MRKQIFENRSNNKKSHLPHKLHDLNEPYLKKKSTKYSLCSQNPRIAES